MPSIPYSFLLAKSKVKYITISTLNFAKTKEFLTKNQKIEITNPALSKALMDWETKDRPKKYKFGLLLVKEGQTLETGWLAVLPS